MRPSAVIRPLTPERAKIPGLTCQKVQLHGSAKPAPFVLRPFAGLYNPYPYGCSVLCNHPADCEAKEVVRRAKETWATEGKALLLPVEMEMIRAGLLPVKDGCRGDVDGSSNNAYAARADTSVPEELFRKYTDTDSRPLTPTPTLASGPSFTHRAAHDDTATCNPRERTTLVLDLRTQERDQECEIFSWHALTLEPPPSIQKSELANSRPVPDHASTVTTTPLPSSPASILPAGDVNNVVSSKSADEFDDSVSEEVPMRRRGKRRRKRKYRRGSTYGQQTEVRDPPEPLDTQVSQINGDSGRESVKPSVNELSTVPVSENMPSFTVELTLSSSFIPADLLQHLCRDLDREAVEWEFSRKKKIALEEALRVKKELHISIRGLRQTTQSIPQNAPRIFSRQSARFEILDSQSLNDLTPLEYLAKYVFISDNRKFLFSRVFNKYSDENDTGVRYMHSKDMFTALEEILGKQITKEQEAFMKDLLCETAKSLNFRTWCGICALTERLLPPLADRETDPPHWVEKADFEALERRLQNAIEPHPQLVLLLRCIRDR